MKPKGIFVHSLFRTGSTYFWNKFRKQDRYYCYYEPLHQVLANLNPNNVGTALTANYHQVNHPNLKTPYLTEYLPLLYENRQGPAHFKKEFSFDQFCYNEKNPDLETYIHSLMKGADEKTPVLQFNRTALRISWFQKYFPSTLHLYLVRHPRDQWTSYGELQKRTGYGDFFLMDLTIAFLNRKTPEFTPLARRLNLTQRKVWNFYLMRKSYKNLLKHYSWEERYLIFYYTWLRSLVENHLYSDRVIHMDRLAGDQEYKREVHNFLEKLEIDDLDFNDARPQTYTHYPLDRGTMRNLEKEAALLVAQSLAPGQLEEFFSKTPDEILEKCLIIKGDFKNDTKKKN